MEWPAVLGIYGAIAATLTAAWSIWSGLRDRGRLKLELRLRRFERNEIGEPIERPVDSLKGGELHLTAVNVGRRPIRPDAWRGIPRRRLRGTADITFAEAIRQRPLNATEHCTVGNLWGQTFVLRISSQGNSWTQPIIPRGAA